MSNDRDTLRQICAALTHEYKVPIELDEQKEGAHTDMSGSKKIVLGTKNLHDFGLDYHVGLVLHEVAHLRYSPSVPKGFEGYKGAVLNLVEDKRIEDIMGAEYAGGDYFLDALHKPSLEAAESILLRPLKNVQKYASVNQIVASSIHWGIDYDELKKQHGSMYETPYEKAKIAAEKEIANKVKEKLFIRVAALARLMYENRAGIMTTTHNDELDRLAEKVADKLRQARGASFEKTEQLAKDCIEILKEILPDKSADKKGESEEDSESKKGTSHQHVSFERKEGGHGDIDMPNLYRQDARYKVQDAAAKPMVAKLKKKLIARMRDNQHQRYVGGKRKGLVDKKVLQKVAAQNYRVYRKREEKKGKDYSVALLVDTSGSMFNHAQRIETAFFSASLMARAFRGLGFPTSMTIYGKIPHTVLYARDRYVVDDIVPRLLQSSGEEYAYGSGYNETHLGIHECLKLLDKNSTGRDKLLVIITDGGLTPEDVVKSRAVLAAAQKKGLHVFIYYVEASTQRLLNDKSHEREIQNSEQLIPACVELATAIIA